MQEYLTICLIFRRVCLHRFSTIFRGHKKATLFQILVEIRRQLFQTATWFKSPVFRIKSVCVWQTFSGFLPLRSLLTLLFQPLRQCSFKQENLTVLAVWKARPPRGKAAGVVATLLSRQIMIWLLSPFSISIFSYQNCSCLGRTLPLRSLLK